MSVYADRREISWQASTIRWDGDTFTIEIPHFLHPWPCYWLHRHLEAEIDHLFKGPVPRPIIMVSEAVREEDNRGVRVHEGTIRMSRMAEDWPDADELREAVERAADEAYRQAEAADATGQAFLARLGGVG